MSYRPVLTRLGIILIMLFVMDRVLTLVPSPFQKPAWHETGDPTSAVGIEIVPSVRTTEREACLSAEITTNSAGWRDRERTLRAKPGITRIAFLGDSFVEGAQVDDDQTVTRRMETILGEKTEVLNFGLSSIGTVQERILADTVVPAYAPATVILGLYMNDIANNLPELEGGAEKNTPLAYLDESGSIVRFRKPRAFASLRNALRRTSPLYRLFTMAVGTARSVMNRETQSSGTGSTAINTQYLAFGVPPDALWQKAWKVTESSILAIKRSTKSKGAHFVLVLFPSVLEVARDPEALYRKELMSDPPKNFDVAYLQKRLTTFAAKNGIDVVDLRPVFIRERDRRHLQFPYFSFPCDGHLNAEGLKLAAETIVEKIRTEK